jgi:BirA family biotin operon repressor/biotin-[acetyl-CoA-carboxylase] ligase
VIGVGINVRLSDATRGRIGQAAADLETACGSAPDRNRLLAEVLRALDRVLEEFGREGFAPLREEWRQRHAQQDRRVTLTLPDGTRRSGHARGVADDGALLLETGSGTQRFHSGEITLRPQGR